MYTVEIPLSKLSHGRLPAICPITGATEQLVFRRVKLSWHPRWVYLFVPLGVVLALVMAAVMSRRATAELPFGRGVYFRAQLGEALFFVTIIAGFFGMIMGTAIVVGVGHLLPGVLLLLGSAVAPTAIWWTMVRNRALIVRAITDSAVILRIPNQRAAMALAGELTGVGMKLSPAAARELERACAQTHPAPDRTLCATHADTQAAWTCGRCGSFFCPRCAEYPLRVGKPVCAPCVNARTAS